MRVISRWATLSSTLQTFFEVGKFWNARVHDDNVVGPLDENTGDFQPQAAQICRDHRLQYQIVVYVARGQRRNGNVGVHLQDLDVQPLVLEVSLKLGHAAA